MSLEAHCELLRSLHVPGSPLVLPNAWDVASAKAVVDAGFPVVATTSGGVAAALGFEDHEGAPADEMLAAAARIAHAVDVPLTVDAEAGYGLEPAELVDALQEASAAGCNLEDTNHPSGALRDPHEHAAWLRRVRDAASYPLVINARVDVFLADREAPQPQLVPEALERARTYLDAGVDCVYPIFLREADALATFVSEAPGPVNVLAFAEVPSLAELAEMGVARVSYGSLLHRLTMDAFASTLASIPAHPA
jgi:2-methylisocitrate lyase-like PEP mutase family enzyme